MQQLRDRFWNCFYELSKVFAVAQVISSLFTTNKSIAYFHTMFSMLNLPQPWHLIKATFYVATILLFRDNHFLSTRQFLCKRCEFCCGIDLLYFESQYFKAIKFAIFLFKIVGNFILISSLTSDG